MKKSTNYYNTFIEAAEDSKAVTGVEPPMKGSKKSVANYEYEIIFNNPYKYTSDDVFFHVYAERNGLAKSDLIKERELFFSKGRPCFRASPLTKTYGWGVHSNENGKVALYAINSKEYAEFVKDESVTKKKAMRSNRK